MHVVLPWITECSAFVRCFGLSAWNVATRYCVTRTASRNLSEQLVLGMSVRLQSGDRKRVSVTKLVSYEMSVVVHQA